MFNFQTHRLLIISTILSSAFSLVIVLMTIYHHFTITQMINNVKREYNKKT